MSSAIVLLFGDQLSSKSPALRQLYALSRHRPSLKAFLEDATKVVRSQLKDLLPFERVAFGDFVDMLELVNHYESSSHLNEVVGTVLTTIIQLADLLVLSETQPDVLGTASNSHQVGVCIGLLAAAVATTARNAIDVATLGLECIAVAFRLGLELWRRTRLVDESPDSWGCTIIGMSPDEIQKHLDEFNKSFAPLRRVYVGVQATTWSTLFAPPSTMHHLCGSPEFGQTPQSRLPSAMAVHANHLPPLDVKKIVGNCPALDTAVPSCAVLSTSTKAPYSAPDLKTLLHLIVEDISQKPLFLETTVKNLASSLEAGDITDVQLIPVGPTHSVSIVQRELQRGVKTVNVGQSSYACAGRKDTESGHVAIVGMSGRFPDSESTSELWDLLQSGRSTHTRIPKSRFDVSDFFDPSLETPSAVATEVGCFLRNPGEFDNLLFNISPREAMQMDPIQRLMLMTTYEALQMAGYSRNATISTLQAHIGTFLGQSAEEWKAINDQEGTDTHYIPGTMRSFAAGRLNHFFHWGGGITSVDTACSASACAIHLACKALLSREIDTAVAGGGHICVGPALYSGLSKGGFLSTGPCQTFNDAADGYCRGEAVGVLVLKRLEDAVSENDNILAVIRGSERNSNAGTGSITYPSSDAQAALYRRILHDSATEANEISFVEMHGTGTQAGDAAEMSALLSTFGRDRPSAFPLYVGAIKAAVGHSEGAAGVSSLIKAVLMLQKRAMPPQPGWPFKVNHKFASLLDEANVKISDGKASLQAAETGNGLCKILVNSFDAAGGNVSLLLEESAPVVRSLDGSEPSYHVVVASGRTPKTLAANEARLRDYLSSHPDTDMASLSYTTTARRIHELQNRSAFVCRSVTELLTQMEASQGTQPTPNRHADPQLAYTFTGQGSAYTAMGLELYQSKPQFRTILDTLQDICDNQGLARFLDIIQGTQEMSTATASQVQLSLVALEIALARYLAYVGLQPSIVAGHSLGEYAALAVAGVLSVADALFLVHTRATLIEEHCTAHAYSMLAVPVSVSSAEDLISEVITSCSSCEIACVNAPAMTVISGKTDDLKFLQSFVKSRDLQATLLTVPFGFHSSQLDPVLDAFEEAATKVHFATPVVPVASTLLGQVVDCGGVFDASYLRRQMREPVNFLGAIQACEKSGHLKAGTVAIEIGPHSICTGLLRKSCPDAQLTSLSTMRKGEDSCQGMAKLLAGAYVAGVSLRWRELYKDGSDSVQLLELPPYAFDSKTYWIPYKTPKAVATIAVQDQGSVQQSPAGTQLPYTCLQMLDSFVSSEDGSIKATFSSKTAQNDLFSAIRGHVVGGVSLCPASIFIEMAHTAATHVLQTTGALGDSFHLEVAELQMTSALLVRERDPEQVVCVKCSLDPNNTALSVEFSSTKGGSSSVHGTCMVFVSQKAPDELQQWKHMGKLVRNRVIGLIDSAKDGPVHRMSRSLFYQLFGTLVEYNEPYQSVKEAYVSPDFQDAAAMCSLGGNTASGVYTCNPFAMDGIVHLSGFILNADLAKDKDIIHVSNRIGSFQLLKELSPQKNYVCYARIREQTAKGRTVCDVYVYDDADLVAACTEICFQSMAMATFSSLIIGQPKPSAHSRPVPSSITQPRLQRSRQDFPLPPAKEAKAVNNPADILLQAIASKTGVSLSDLGPSVSFSDIGVDSQMSIAITSEFKKRSNIDLPASFFISNSTVQEARAELTASDCAEPAETVAEIPSRSRQRSPVTRSPETTVEHRPAQAARLSQALLQIVSNEVGIPADEFADIGDWESAGIDSMITIKLVSLFKQKTGVELPATFFQTFPTLAEVEMELDGDSASASSGSDSEFSTPTALTPTLTPPEREYESRAVLILGSSKSTQRPVFMIADGHGSADAYVHLSPLPKGQRLYALESPFVDDPEAFTLTIPQLAHAYIKTIRRLQPKGPYIIGGRSAGAAYAYEVAYQLTAQNETISGLILIDMRVPRAVPHAVHINAKFVAKAWQVIVAHTNVLLDEGDLCHAAATIRALHSYDPTPLPEHRQPLLKYVIWAAMGVNENRTQTLHDKSVSRPAAMGPPLLGRDLDTVSLEEFEDEFKSWFWGERSTFGPNGWDVLIGGNVQTETVDGDHFCMVSPPWVKSLSAALVDAVTEIENSGK